MVRERSQSRAPWIVVAAGFACGLGSASAVADMYRWVDARGVVNYSNIPPGEGVRAKHIPDTQPTVSVIPPPDRLAEQREALREAQLLRRIEQLEDEIAELRRASVPVTVVAVPAPEPVFTYATPIVWPSQIFPWPAKHIRGHPSFKPRHPGWGPRVRPGGRPPMVSHGRPSGLTVRARF